VLSHENRSLSARETRRRRRSDASLLALLLFDTPEERAAQLPAIRAALRREGLAALARKPPAIWPAALVPHERARARLVAAL